ncbi:MAG: ATP-grasp domain-containing protein [Chloroflexota bacterium]|nr:ATP-grasp domain-containing protein [Chloroflexota bacterium]
MPTNRYRVGVTGLNATDDPQPGIGVARCLRASGLGVEKVVGLSYDALDTGIYDKGLLDEVYLLPYPGEGEGALFHRIKEIHRKAGLDVIIPTLDLELMNFIHLEGELADMGIHLLLPSETALRNSFKSSLYDFFRSRGFAVPRGSSVVDPGQLKGLAKELGFPLVVKGLIHEAQVAYTLDEANVAFNKIGARWGFPLIVQEYIPGEEYDVAGVGDRNGQCVGAVAMRKLRVTDRGKAWYGISIYDHELLGLAKAMLEELGWVGPLEMEFIKKTSGGYCIMEVNPRFPAWIYLTAGVGVNLPEAVVRIAKGEEIAHFNSYKAGVIFARHVVDLICPISYLEALTSDGELLFGKK